MPAKPFPWRKLTPAQIEFLERLATAQGALPYGLLSYRDVVAFDELRRLGFVDMQPNGRSKLQTMLTDKGRALRDNGYRTTRVVLRITKPQIALLRYLDDGEPHETSIGRGSHELPGMMLDVCRRMHLRGWVERHGGPDGFRWARLAPAGREVLATIDAMDVAIEEMAVARARGRLH